MISHDRRPPTRRAANTVSAEPRSRDDLDESRRRSNKAPAVEAVAADWLSAFVAAERAIHSSRADMGAAYARERLNRLRAEREKTAVLLETLARGRRGAALIARCVGRSSIGMRLLGLPSGVTACIFDVEGTLTTSAAAHRDAWLATLDPFLFTRAEHLGREFIPFDPARDYSTYLAAQPRLGGLRSFLASRGISLSEGDASDAPKTESLHGLANRKQETLQQYLRRNGVEAYAGSRAYLQVARAVRARRAVVSASTNTRLLLQLAGIGDLIEEQIDGQAFEAHSLQPKPSPDTLLAACARLNVDPRNAAAFETTPAGITAARTARIRTVVGVANDETRRALTASNADRVVSDLGELLEA